MNESIIKGKKILIVEDNELNKFILLKYFKNWKAEVDYANNGQVAANFCFQNTYDLILMDLEMPEMDGIEATKLIRTSEESKCKEAPIIALSAADFDDIKEIVYEVGMNDIIAKPFKKELFKKNIIKLFEKNQE